MQICWTRDGEICTNNFFFRLQPLYYPLTKTQHSVLCFNVPPKLTYCHQPQSGEKILIPLQL